MFLNIAHRGDSINAPENTLPAFELAIEAGATAVEMDLRCTADGHVVVLHDKSIDRTTDGTGTLVDLSLELLMQKHRKWTANVLKITIKPLSRLVCFS